MDADRIRTRISDRLFNKGAIESREEPRTEKVNLLKGRLKKSVKRFIRMVPAAGPLIVWLWRLIKIPGRFYQLSEHFRASVEEQAKALQEIDVLRASIEEQGKALRELDVLRASVEEQGIGLREIDVLRAAIEEQGIALREIDVLRAALEEQGKALRELDVLRASVEEQGIALREIGALAKSLHAQLNQPIEVPDVLVVHPPSYLNRKEQINNDDAFYQLFSNTFRGSEPDITARQQKYLPYVIEAFKSARGGSYFLDVGCGRGEFLTLLKNAGLTAKGVDINAVEHQRLTDQGLDVHLIDANTFLSRIEDHSLIGISAFQTVEHFSDEYLKVFLTLAYQKIAMGGILMVETVNPQCRAALANFFNDPSHVKPLPVALLTFYIEFYGFSEIKILYSSPCEELHRVKDVAEYNYMDYAVIGRKI